MRREGVVVKNPRCFPEFLSSVSRSTLGSSQPVAPAVEDMSFSLPSSGTQTHVAYIFMVIFLPLPPFLCMSVSVSPQTQIKMNLKRKRKKEFKMAIMT